jgi:hypothetical protein
VGKFSTWCVNSGFCAFVLSRAYNSTTKIGERGHINRPPAFVFNTLVAAILVLLLQALMNVAAESLVI